MITNFDFTTLKMQVLSFGSSGSGKSSLINTIARKDLVEVGDGTGYSTT
jgi:predicted GTPase